MGGKIRGFFEAFVRGFRDKISEAIIVVVCLK
jgi:hypothetical protein